MGVDMPADFTLKVTLPPSSGKGAAMSISVMPGYQSGQRLASLKSAMVSCGEALIWTLRCTIAIGSSPLSVAAPRSVTLELHVPVGDQRPHRQGAPAEHAASAHP